MNIQKLNNNKIIIILKYIIGFIVLLCFWFILISRNLGIDTDTFWHIKVGEQIVKTGQITTANPFTWIQNSGWNQQEWLFDVILYFFVHTFDIWGFYILHAVFSIFLFFISYKYAKPNKLLLFCVVYIVIRFIIPQYYINRPAEYSSIFFILFLILYEKIDYKKLFIYFLVGIFLSNFHCGQAFILLAFMCLQFGLDLIYLLYNKKRDILNKKYILYRISTIFVYILGLFINPLGYIPIISMVKAIFIDNSYIYEWLPFASSNLITLCIIFIFFIALFFAKCDYTRKDFINIGLLASLFILLFKSRKAGILFTYCYSVIGYYYIELVYNNLITNYIKTKTLNLPKINYNKITIIISIILAILLCGFMFNGIANNSFDKSVYLNVSNLSISNEILDYLKENKPDRLLHGYITGNILLWNDIKVFQDSRQHPYIKEMGYEDTIQETFAMNKDKTGDQINKYFDKYNFDYVLINSEFNITWYLENRSDYIQIINTEIDSLWKKVEN